MLESLLDLIQSGELLSSPCFDCRDLEECLDQRDEPDFEDGWLAASNRVESLVEQHSLSTQELALLDRIREAAFKRTFEATGYPDICGYVSDDFELIAKAVLVAPCDAFVLGLFEMYRMGMFPCEPIVPKDGDLLALLGSA